MADFEQKNDLDLRYGGSTLGDFGYFYDVELPWLFACINSIRRNQAHPAGQSVEPVPYQIKIEDNKVFIRNENNSDWVFMFDVSFGGGLRQEGQKVLTTGEMKIENNKFYIKNATTGDWVFMFDVAFGGGIRQEGQEVLTTGDKAGSTTELRKNKLAVYDEDGNIPASITGSAGSIAGKRVDLAGIVDGQIIAYSEGLNKWIPTDKFSGLGMAKYITFLDAKGAAGSYNGDSTTTLDFPIKALLPNTTYQYGEIANTRLVGTNISLVCVQSGTTPATITALE